MKIRLFFVLLVMCGVAAGTAIVARADNLVGSNFTVQDSTLGTGGFGTSTDFSLLGVISPYTVGSSTSVNFGDSPGFAAFPFVSTPVISVTPGGDQVTVNWTAAQAYLGYSVSGYVVGQSLATSGPYTFTAVGNILSYTASALTAGTPYYFIVRALDPSGITIATSTEVAATPTTPSNNNNEGGSVGGGGTSGISPSTGATVTFSGRAYPYSTVVLLKDGQMVVTTTAGGDARFNISLTNLSAGDYIFSIYGVDTSGNRSSSVSLPESVSADAITTVGGIFIAPTISVDKSVVKRGDNITIFGQAAASSTVTISIHSNPEVFVTAPTDDSGAYLYNFDTAPLDYGAHVAKSKATVNNNISNFGAAIGFAVGTQTVLARKNGTNLIGDLNGDGRVNLVDFSIMVYWFGRPLTANGVKADLNGDGNVDLTDFSILASHWTG